MHRARKYLDSIHSDITLVITGGLRVSADFAKAMDDWDKAIAREDPWAFKEFVGTWPTKKDKGLV